MLFRSALIVSLLAVCIAAASAAEKPKKPAEKKAKKTSEHVKYPEFEKKLLLSFSVDAGEVDRVDTPVAVELPPTVNPHHPMVLFEVGGGEKKIVPMQIEAGSPARLWLTLTGKTAASTTRRFELWPGDPAVFDSVQLDLGERTLDVSFGGRKLFSYNHVHVVPPEGVPHEFIRNAYIYPLFNPAGQLIAEDFPADHYHHKGIWMPWTNTMIDGHRVDFWNLGDRSGAVRFAGFAGIQTGAVFGQFRANHEFVDVSQTSARPAGTVAIDEQWDVKVYAQGGEKRGDYWLFDLTSRQRNVMDKPIVLPEYRYGGIGYRGAKEWKDDNYVLLTSEGKDKTNGHTTRAKWCAHSGSIDGKWTTVVVMGHPTNFRFPEPQRIWEKGGCFFNFAPSQLGEWSMEPGKDFVWRYRFYIYDGKIDASRIERAWQDFGNPPKVTMTPVTP